MSGEAAACGQSGSHSPHMYQSGTWPNGDPKYVLCNGQDTP